MGEELLRRQRLERRNARRDFENWNGKHGINTEVIVQLDDGTLLPTRTTSEAWLLGGHTAVIKVEGISGAYRLDRIAAIKDL